MIGCISMGRFRLAHRGVRRAAWPFVLVSTMTLGMVASCHRARQPEVQVTITEEIEPEVPVVGPATIMARLSDGRGRPVTGALVTVEGDMSHPGMSPIFSRASELPDGRYRAPIEFGMPGDWVVLLHVKLRNGQTVERQVDVKGVRAK